MKIYANSLPLKADLNNIASDKSLSHRTAIFSLLSDKPSRIRNFLRAEDTLNTLKIISQLGSKISDIDDEIIINPNKIMEPNSILNCGNSGTAMRLLMGFLASKDGFFVLSGDEFLNNRPMARISKPLIDVGAEIYGRDNSNRAPICIRGRKLSYFEFESKISSAQVKTAIILAALNSNGCKFKENELSRDHSEKMLIAMGAPLLINGLSIDVSPLKAPLNPLDIDIANDPSSAFFFAVACFLIPGSHIILRNLILNKTRIAAYEILKKMGGKINIIKKSNKYEEIGDIEVAYSPLKAICVEENISWLIDEIPALAIAFSVANGVSFIKNAKELRVKESDRIAVMVRGLQKCGINAVEFDDGFSVEGGKAHSAIIDSHSDHRIAMSFAILGLSCGMIIEKSEFIATSFPNFGKILRQIGVMIEN